MGVDVSARARVLGISMEYTDLRSGSAQFLPQHVYLIAQGNDDAVYSSTKFLAGSAAEVAAVAGYGSPAHHAMRQLRPVNGDGAGTVPITVCLLQQNGSGTNAAGAITPVGTQTAAGEYRVLVGNIASNAFVIPKNATPTDVCRLIRDAILGTMEMPVRTSFTYGSPTASAVSGTGNGTVTALSVTGTPTPGAWILTCTAAVANGGVFSLTDPYGTVVATGLTLTVGAGSATVFTTNGIQFTVNDGTTDFGVGAKFTITVPATALNLTVKWKGVSGNAVRVSVEGDSLGITFGITQPSGGLANPSVQPALDQMGNVWYSMVLNCLNIDDTTALDAIQTTGEGRWGELVHKPFVAFTGNTLSTVALATAVSSVRRTDRINAQLVNPGSDDMPFVVAARQLARIVRVANNNPARDYGSQKATGLTPGADGVQWDYLVRDQAVKLGSSTVEVRDGVVNIADVVTFYRPTGEEPPAYSYVCDIVKLQSFIYSTWLIFAQEEWDGAPLIPDEQPVTNDAAKKPKMARAAMNNMIDALALQAVIGDAATAKKLTQATMDTQNPKRLNIQATAPIAGNSNLINVELKFAFIFGARQAA